MKRYLIFLIINGMVQVQADKSRVKPILMHTPSAAEYESRFLTSWSETEDIGRPYSYVLNSKDINNSVAGSSAMKTISSAGRYYFTEDIHSMPINTDVTCFKITASNVVIDLRGYSLTGATATGAGAIGIEVAAGISNVTICNGNINSINGNAIKTGANSDNIIIRDLIVSNCMGEGIYLQSTDSLLERVSILKGTGSYAGANGAIGLYLTSAHRFRAVDSYFDGNQATAEDLAAGVYASSSLHCDFVNCNARQNRAGSEVSTDHNAYGFYFNACDNVHLHDCVAGYNTSQTGTAYGFYFNNTDGAFLEKCYANKNTAAGAQAYGFALSSGSESCTFIDCVAHMNQSDEHAYGFAALSSDYNSFLGCHSSHQFSTSLVLSTTVAGFYSDSGVGNRFENCFSFGNTSASLSGAVVAGFYLTNGEQHTTIIDSRSQGNTSDVGSAYGIWLDSAKYCMVRSNEVFVNTGSVNGYGIRDELASSVSVFFQNVCYHNASQSGVVVNNYDVKLSPNDDTDVFPVKIGYLTDFTNLQNRNEFENLEIIEQPPS